MTREEAIDKLQDLWNEVYNEDSDGYDYAVAIDTAIEALQTERRNAIIDALDSVTFYNGLAEEVESWKDLEPSDYNSISAPDNIVIPKAPDDYQLQVIWIILVELFGDCGTSPRSGWIYTANREEINKFIDRITYTEMAMKGGDDE